MQISYEDLRLPKIYKREGKECYLDPIRKKLIYITPEETVRQKVISYLVDELKVPSEAMVVEQHLSHYGIKSNRRADIVVEGITKETNQCIPIAIVECKAPDVPLDEKAINQVLDYCDAIGANYAMLVNQFSMRCYKYVEDEKKYIHLEELPCYKDMLEGKYDEWDIGTPPERIPFDKLEEFLKEEFQEEKDNPRYLFTDISSHTEMPKAVMSFNLLEGLLDASHKFPLGNYGKVNVIEDMGVRLLTYGDASGGYVSAPYRSFMIGINGNTEIVSFSITTYRTWSKLDCFKTCLNVALDNEDRSHHALQLVIDDNVTYSNRRFEFFHHGKIAVGKLGSGKVDELRQFVSADYPELIKGNKFYLGSVVNDRLFFMDDDEIVPLIVNLIKYALVRDEYRKYVKQRKPG